MRKKGWRKGACRRKKGRVSMRIGTAELFLVLAIVILVFGPTQIPKLGKMTGRGIKKLRKGLEEMDDENETKQGNE